MDYQLPTIFAPTLAQEIKKPFLNPPMGDMPITEKKVGTPLAHRKKHVSNINEKRTRAVFNCLELVALSSAYEKKSLHE